MYPLYGLLFTMPGVPSICYGSEWGMEGKRTRHSDKSLRPAIDLVRDRACFLHPDLAHAIRRFAQVRRALPALRYGDYRQLHVAHEQVAFARCTAVQTVVVAVNASDHPAAIRCNGSAGTILRDALNPPNSIKIMHGYAEIHLPPNWLRVMEMC